MARPYNRRKYSATEDHPANAVPRRPSTVSHGNDQPLNTLKQYLHARRGTGPAAVGGDRERRQQEHQELRNAIRLFVSALAEGKTVQIQLPQLSAAEISSELLDVLTDRWLDDIMVLLSSPASIPVVPSVLPAAPSELYQRRVNKSESIIDFLRRVWLPWISSGLLTRPAFRKLDTVGEKALQNWLHNHPGEMPEDLILPTKSEVVERELLNADPGAIRDAHRLTKARQRRTKSANIEQD
jgi:hypothetical protein